MNSHVRSLTGGAFTAKDFRTLRGTIMAAEALARIGTVDTAKERKRAETLAVRATADALGNTPAVARGAATSTPASSRRTSAARLLALDVSPESAIQRLLADARSARNKGEGVPRPPVFRARMLGLVVAGGVLGVALRELLLLPFGTGQAAADSLVLPAATMGVNVVGSFALGIVVGRLGDRHPLARAFLGTGVLGGFTTYSAFAVQTAPLLGVVPWRGHRARGACRCCSGWRAAALGLRLTQRRRQRRPARRPTVRGPRRERRGCSSPRRSPAASVRACGTSSTCSSSAAGRGGCPSASSS